MSAELPDNVSGAAHPPLLARRHRSPRRHFLRRALTRRAWSDEPDVRVRWLPEADAVVVDIVPLPSQAQILVYDLLAIELDGDDPEALPTRMCLTGLTEDPDSLASARARWLLGTTLWSVVEDLVRSPAGPWERTMMLSEDVLARLRGWRRLHGVAIGVDVQPGCLDVVLVGIDGDQAAGMGGENAIVRRMTALPDMGPEAVVGRIATVVAELRREWHAEIAGAPVVAGVQVPGPVDPATGVVHHFQKRDRSGRSSWGWEGVPLARLVEEATGLPTIAINDVVGYAAYERWTHPAPEERCRAVLLVSQGIGAKLIVDGEIEHRMPMEIGNIVIEPGGRRCDCGARGCVEATAGTRAILEQFEEAVGVHVADIDEAITLLDANGRPSDPRILDILRRAGHDLARAIGIVQAVANPSSWAVYGPYSLLAEGGTASNAFLRALHEYAQFVSFKPYKQTAFRRRPIAGGEGATGAALSALEHHGLAGRSPYAEPVHASRHDGDRK